MKLNVNLSILLVLAILLIVATGLFLYKSISLSKEITQYQMQLDNLLWAKEQTAVVAKEYMKQLVDEKEQLQFENDRLLGEVNELGVVQNVPKELTLPELVEDVIDGVVHIKCSQWQGSGFVIGPRLIKTARHVVEGITDFTITTNDGHVVKATRAISHGSYDTACIYIDDLTCVAEGSDGKYQVELKVLELGSIKDCRLGEEIFLIGSPLGQIHFNAVTVGYISKLDTRLEDFNYPKNYGWSDTITIDAVALGGNSGCPIFNMSGSVVGILVGGKSDALNWIVPVDVFIDDIDVIMMMFVMNKYRVEKVKDNSIYRMHQQISNLQWQVDNLQSDGRLSEVYEWFLEQEFVIENLKQMVENLMRSVTLAEYMNERAVIN